MQCYVLPGICQRVHTVVRKQQEFWSWGNGHKVRLTQLLLLQPHLELSQGVPKPLGSHPGFSSLWSSTGVHTRVQAPAVQGRACARSLCSLPGSFGPCGSHGFWEAAGHPRGSGPCSAALAAVPPWAALPPHLHLPRLSFAPCCFLPVNAFCSSCSF